MDRREVVLCLIITFCFVIEASQYDDDLFTACSDNDQVHKCSLRDNKAFMCTNMIPDNPHGYESVVIKWCTERLNEESLNITEELFINANWTLVKRFTYIKSQNIGFHTIIGPFAFQHMSNLEMVRLHVLKSQLLLNRHSFCGAENIKSLNFSGSTYLQQHFVTQILFNDDCLSNLEELSLSGISLHHDLDFNHEFLSLVFRRPVRVLDLRFLHVRNLNITTVANHCERLEYLYLSDSMFEHVEHGLPSTRICPNLKIVDVSGAQFNFMKLLCMVRNLRHGYATSTVKADGDFKFLVHTETLIWDRLCPQSSDRTTPLNIRSAKLVIETPKPLRRLFIRNNNIDVFDAEIEWLTSDVEHIDLSNNSISYLNSRFFSFGDKFRHVCLSGNRLSVMVTKSAADFENLFTPLVEVRYLSLARNNFTVLPKYSFLNNTKLEVLDLSFNLISNLSFSFEHISNLTLLNLSRNRIDFKDPHSLIPVNNYIGMVKLSHTNWLDISHNPLTCNQSADLNTITFLIKSNKSFYNLAETKCSSENGSLIPINQETLRLVEEIYKRPVWNLIFMAISTVITIVISVCMYKARSIWLNRQLQRTEANRLELLRQSAAGHEFAVFLSYSSDDQYFVKEHIYDQLNEALQSRLDINRDLVFVSEMHMRAGVSIKDGIRDAFARSAVLLFILTDSTVDSEWCIFEFHEALDIGKPIVIMVKDIVNEDVLPEQIKTFFANNTRIFWKKDDNGEYMLETSWDNVCESIMSAS